jgi:sugar lactone lactonase YvrE
MAIWAGVASRLMRAALVSLALVAFGCTPAPTTLLCNVAAQGGVTITALEVVVTLGTGAQITRPLPPGGGAPQLPGSVMVILPDMATTVDVGFSAVDSQGAPYSASAMTVSQPHEQVVLSFTLGPGQLPDAGLPDAGGSDSGMPVKLSTLSLLAGPIGGAGSADGVGSDARLAYPQGLALVGTMLYVVEASGGFRQIDTTTNTVSTIRVTDTSNSPYGFNYGQGVVGDGAGNFYVSSTNEHLIVKVAVNGLAGSASFFAGQRFTGGSADGPLATATFNHPTGLALDGNGNLFVADGGNATVRQIVLATGQVSTIAGTPGMTGWVDQPGPAARFNRPNGLAVVNGNLYVADSEDYGQGNSGLRMISLASPSPMPVTTVVGAPGSSSTSDGPVASAGFAEALGIGNNGAWWVVDSTHKNLRSVVLGGNVTTIAGNPGGAGGSLDGNGTAARFFDPRWLALDANNAYISDDQTMVIRKVGLTAPYPVSTPMGAPGSWGFADAVGGNALFDGPYSAAPAGNDAVYIGEWNNNGTIRKITISTGAVETVVGGSTTVGNPWAIAVDNAGNLWVTDRIGGVLREVSFSGGGATVTVFAGTLNMHESVDGVGAAGHFDEPSGIAFDGDHTLYVADHHAFTLRSIDMMTKQVTTIAGLADMAGSNNGPGLSARLGDPSGLAWDSARKRLYIVEEVGDIRVVTFNPVTVALLAGQTFRHGHTDGAFSSASFNSPEAAAIDATSDVLYVADGDDSTVRRLDLKTQMVTTPIGVVGHAAVKPGPLPASLNSPTGLAVVGGALVIVNNSENDVLIAR